MAPAVGHLGSVYGGIDFHLLYHRYLKSVLKQKSLKGFENISENQKLEVAKRTGNPEDLKITRYLVKKFHNVREDGEFVHDYDPAMMKYFNGDWQM